MTGPPRLAGFLTVALALLTAISRGAEPVSILPDDVFARPPGDDAADVVLFGTGRAAVVRVHLKLGAKGFRTSWGDFVVRLHAYLDRNDDGILTTDEANRAPWTNLLQNPFNGFQPVRPGSRPTAVDASPKDGKVSYEELVAYLQRTQNFEPLNAEAGPPADPRAEAVFGRFDRDGDKTLTAAELTDTEGLVARLDRDEDETLSLDEFTPDRSPLADRFLRGNRIGIPSDPSTSAAALLTTPEAITAVASRLLNAYGEPGKKLIRPEPLGANPQDFERGDADGDGRLNLAELKRYLLAPTSHLELSVTLPAPRSGTVRIETVASPAGRASPGSLKARTNPNGTLAVELESSEVELQASEPGNNSANVFEQQFKNADVNKDGIVDFKEARGNFFLQRMHPVADRDADGKLTTAELKAYVDLSLAAQDARPSMTVQDRGIALHERLDADHDGRLSRRELRGAKAKLADLDLDHDGRIALGELPRRTQLNFGRGDAQNRSVRIVQTATATVATPGGGNRSAPPAWFVGMDRNRDGDVSAREFLGTPVQFREFDADGDGLIDRAEASRALETTSQPAAPFRQQSDAV